MTFRYKPNWPTLPDSSLFEPNPRYPDFEIEVNADGYVLALAFVDPDSQPPHPDLPIVHQLDRYFKGELKEWDLPLKPRGTEFQRAVWAELCKIPYGVTRSYLDVATAIGKPTATRAVGAANGANPIAVIQPCHRVIGSNGALTGFGGGLPTKRALLYLEGLR